MKKPNKKPKKVVKQPEISLVEIVCYRLSNLLRDTKRFFKFRYQRLIRGFSDDETWNLDYTFCKFALPRLRRFKQVSIAYPSNLTVEQWDKVLDEIIFAFEQNLKDYGWLLHLSKKDQARVTRGFKNFGIYFRDLWW